MFSIEDHIFLTITTAESIIGMFVNGYIGLVICVDWIKKKKISTADYLLTSLAPSRMYLPGFCGVCSGEIKGSQVWAGEKK